MLAASWEGPRAWWGWHRCREAPGPIHRQGPSAPHPKCIKSSLTVPFLSHIVPVIYWRKTKGLSCVDSNPVGSDIWKMITCRDLYVEVVQNSRIFPQILLTTVVYSMMLFMGAGWSIHENEFKNPMLQSLL